MLESMRQQCIASRLGPSGLTMRRFDHGHVLDQSSRSKAALRHDTGVVHGSYRCGICAHGAARSLTSGGVVRPLYSDAGDLLRAKHAVKGYTDALAWNSRRGTPYQYVIKRARWHFLRQHAKNLLPVEPLNPLRIRSRQSPGDSHCAENPERDVYVGGGGKALSAAGYHAPRVTDKVMEATMFDLQKSEQSRPDGRDDSLHSPSEDGLERGGYPGHVAESSVYTKASLHPVVTGAIIAGAGVALAAASRSALRGNGDSEEKEKEELNVG